MHNKRFTHIILVLILVLLAGALVFTVASRANAEGDGVDAPEAAAAAVGTAFTYQGSLEKNGAPIDDACDMVFRLYDDTGFQIGGNLEKNGVTVTDGLFSVNLDFGDDAFTGGKRFLQIDVECSGDSGPTTLSPNVALTAAPYALGLRPGALIQGSLDGDDVLTVANTQTGNDSVAVYGRTGAHINRQLSAGIGVRGDSSGGAGVAGYTESNIGVLGFAANSTGANYGVWGATSSPTGYGVYSQGNAHVEGDLTWKPITSYLSITAGAFQPINSSVSYNGTGNWLNNNSGSSADFIALVQLPHQAQITNFTFYWYDASVANNGTALFVRNNLNQTGLALTFVDTSGNSGNGTSNSTTPISIDNSQYAYHVLVTLPDSSVEINGIVIEYTITQPH